MAEYDDDDDAPVVPVHRNRRRGDEDEDEDAQMHDGGSADEADEADEDGDNSMDLDPRPGRGYEGQLVKKLVRYALSCEFSRTPIRRQQVREKVLGEHPRAFKKVFELAQQQLRDVFGMEMRQLPIREKLTLEEKRKAISANSQAKATETWILVSVLPKKYQSPTIMAPSKAPTAAGEATYMGFYTMVIALISLNGGEVMEQKLMRYLSRLNADSKLDGDKTEDVLARMEKSGYVAKRVENVSADQDKNVSWLLGPRGKEEVGSEGVAGVVRAVYGGSTPELERQLAASLGVVPVQEEVEDGEGSDSEGSDQGPAAEVEVEEEEPEPEPERRRGRRAR